MARQLLALRHLETWSNRERRFGSGDTDSALIPGQRVPEEAVALIQKALTDEPCVCYAHTGLTRTMETLEVLAEQLGVITNPQTLPQFRERFGGSLANLAFAEIQARFSGIVTPSDIWCYEAPEQGLERLDGFMERIQEGLRILKEHDADLIVLVTHAGVLKAIRASRLPRSRWLEMMLEPTPSNGSLLTWRL